MKNKIAIISLGLTACVISAALAQNTWTIWPAGAEGVTDIHPCVQIPHGFTRIKSSVPAAETELLNVRLRSTDGKVEFAVAGKSVRGIQPDTVAGRIYDLPLAKGEKVTSRTPEQKTIKSDYPDYISYSEQVVVAGPGYTRYFHLLVSTGALPLTSSEIWEFKVTNEAARKQYQKLYLEFKDKVNFGEF